MHTSSDSPETTGPRLRVEHLSAGYGRGLIVNDVDLGVRPGELVSIIGPNGAGKSTLLKAITGQLKPASGHVYLDERDVTGLRGDRLARAGVGYVPQVRDAFRSLTVRENLELGGYTLPRRQVPARIAAVLETFPVLQGLVDRRVSKLSGGERKMVAIGRLLMTRPTTVILDEPTAGLAPQLADQFLSEQVSRLARQNVAVLLVEQRAREALSISDFAYVLAGGSIKIAGAASEILARPDLSDVFLGLVAEG